MLFINLYIQERVVCFVQRRVVTYLSGLYDHEKEIYQKIVRVRDVDMVNDGESQLDLWQDRCYKW